MADPATITGLVYRIRAQSLGLANGAAVSSWAFDVGGLTLTQATGANQPTYLASGLGGKAAVRFDGVNDSMGSSSNMSARSQPISVVAVIRTNDVADEKNILHMGSTELLVDGAERPELWCGGGPLVSSTASSTTGGGVFTALCTNPSATLYLNGTSVATGAAGGGGIDATVFTLGSHPEIAAPERNFNGDVYEVLVYDHALTAGERQTAHTYVQDTYGITVSDYASTAASLPARRRPAGRGLILR